MAPINIQNITQPVWPPMPKLLLHPNIPFGASGLNPRSVLGQEWWDATRKSAEIANNYCCYACSVHKSDTEKAWLEGHETYEFDYKNHVAKYLRTYSLCNPCHMFIHSGFLQTQWLTYKISKSEYADILVHGVKVLLSASPPLYPTPSQALAMDISLNLLVGDAYNRIRELVEGFPLRLRIAVKLTSAWNMIHSEKENSGDWTLIVADKSYTKKDIL